LSYAFIPYVANALYVKILISAPNLTLQKELSRDSFALHHGCEDAFQLKMDLSENRTISCGRHRYRALSERVVTVPAPIDAARNAAALRVVVWNIEWRTRDSRAGRFILEELRRLDADIVRPTEGYVDLWTIRAT